MMSAGLVERLKTTPRLSQPALARARLADISRDPALATLDLADHGSLLVKLLLGIADHSPFLWQCIRADVARLARVLLQSPEASLSACLAGVKAASAHRASDAAMMELLRRARQEISLLIALADIGGIWTMAEVVAALSEAADVFVACALRHVLRSANHSGALNLPDPAAPEEGCGLVVLALGKLGARELNYSSDVDLVVFFDPQSASLPVGADASLTFVRLAKALAAMLQQRTPDGYVLRVDLRLRPDPGSTAIAISLPAAFHYYETLGQNWERAAFIKARPVAGDLALGAAFLRDLTPFIWRKYFDFAAIADIHAMKRQIHAVRGHSEVEVAGHDVKLGRGGIREVEFFVQTQQLIFGGRRQHLRGSRTLDMLVELQRDGWVTKKAVDDLSAAYVFLRGVEHRLQMLADEQTQRLPKDAEALAAFARFLGFPSVARFSATLVRHLRHVETHYARLFEHAPELSNSLGSLVFTGTADDPDTLATLRKLGFRQPALAAETVRGWHFGRRAAVQSARAREVLTELVPGLLEAFGSSGEPDAAIAKFDSVLGKMPAAIELFSLLKSNATLRELFGDLLGGAPRMADVVALRPHLLDAAIDPAMADQATLHQRFSRSLARALATEDFLDILRDLAQDEMFAIGVRLFSGRIDPIDAGRAYSDLAEVTIDVTLAHVEAVFSVDHGRVPSGRCAVLAMGKLGSREMTATSDLDLMLIYDFDASRPESDGPRPLHAVTYYIRLTQRLVSALTVATRRGKLYDVDLRLRPFGGKGPLATPLRGFIEYQDKEAETWEHMALTRARVVAGDAQLRHLLDVQVRAILVKPRDPAVLRKDIGDMRRLIAAEKGEGAEGDIKLMPGGLLDVEFIAQYLVLNYAATHPGLLSTGTEAVLVAAAELEPAGWTNDLAGAHRLYSNVTQIQRLTLGAQANPGKAPEGVRRRIAAAAQLPDFARLKREISETSRKVRVIFERLFG